MAVGSILSGIAILAGAGGRGGMRDRKRIVELWNKLETSNFDTTQLTFPELRMIQELMPEVYDATVPDEVKTVVEDPRTRTAQFEALGQMGQIAREGLPLADQIAGERIGNQVAQEARGRDLAVLRSLASRGNLGAGDEAQLRFAGNAASNNLARDLGQGLQETALNRRMAAIGAYGGQAGELRAGDFRAGAFNANAVNRFNMDVADIMNEASRYNAGARADANRYNVGTRQRLADTEALGRLDLQRDQQARDDRLKGTLFDQQVTKLGGQSGAYAGLAAARDREKAAREEAIAGIGSGVDDIFSSAIGQGGLFSTGSGVGARRTGTTRSYTPYSDIEEQLREAYGY